MLTSCMQTTIYKLVRYMHKLTAWAADITCFPAVAWVEIAHNISGSSCTLGKVVNTWRIPARTPVLNKLIEICYGFCKDFF